MGHPLYCRSHKLHVGVDDSIRIHVGQLDGLPDLALEALGPGPGDGKLDGLRVPAVLRVFTGEVRGQYIGVSFD